MVDAVAVDLRRGRPDRAPVGGRGRLIGAVGGPPLDPYQRPGARRHRGPLASAGDPLPALGVPGHRAARPRPRSSRTCRASTSPTTSAPAPRSSRPAAIPTRDTWTFTAAGAAVGGPAVGRAGHPRGGLPPRRLDRARPAPRGPRRRHLRLPLRSSAGGAGSIERDAALLTLAAFVVSAVALGAAAAAHRDGALRGRPRCWSPTAAPIPRRLWAIPVLVLVWANVHGSFFLGPRRPRPRLARGPPRPRRRGRTGRCSSRSSRVARRLRHPVRPGRLGLRGRPVDQLRGHAAHHRVAADVAADVPGHAVLRRRRSRSSSLIARRGGAHAVADARLARRLLRDRRLRDPRRRLVAARRPSPRSPASS